MGGISNVESDFASDLPEELPCDPSLTAGLLRVFFAAMGTSPSSDQVKSKRAYLLAGVRVIARDIKKADGPEELSDLCTDMRSVASTIGSLQVCALTHFLHQIVIKADLFLQT